MSNAAESGRPRIVVVTGPTASGKTARAIEWAERFGGEIINADSQQVYRYMDIGTAKPTPQERARVPHHLLDRVDPDQPYHAGRFESEAREAIAQICGRGKTPFVVGGSGLYIRALLEGLTPGVGRDPELRAALEAEHARAGEEGDPTRLHRRLAEVDPASAARLHPNDALRIVRALEIYEQSGRPASEFHTRGGGGATDAGGQGAAQEKSFTGDGGGAPAVVATADGAETGGAKAGQAADDATAARQSEQTADGAHSDGAGGGAAETDGAGAGQSEQAAGGGGAAETDGAEAGQTANGVAAPAARYHALHLALDPGREELAERINRRCEAMLEAGLLQEVRELRRRGFGPELPSMRAIGYRHIQPVLEGRQTLAGMLPLLQQDTRRFARRQRGWLRGVPGLLRFHPEREAAEALAAVARFLDAAP